MTVNEALQTAEKLLPEAKVWVRKTAAKLEDEIRQTTAAAILDLQLAGIINISAEDSLIKEAVKLYLKAHFGFNEDSAKYEAAYEHLKAALSLNSEYTQAEQVSAGGA